MLCMRVVTYSRFRFVTFAKTLSGRNVIAFEDKSLQKAQPEKSDKKLKCSYS